MVNTPIGPVAIIEGEWHSVNGKDGVIWDVRYRLRPEEREKLGLPVVESEWHAFDREIRPYDVE